MVTNDGLAVLLKAQHEAVTQRLDELTDAVKTTNGRLRNVEQTSAVHSWAIGIIGVIALALLYTMLKLIFKV